MKRFGQVIGVKPEKFQEYVDAHAAVWPEVLDMITQCNIKNYSIYHHNNTLFSYFEYHGDDFDADMRSLLEEHAGRVLPEDPEASLILQKPTDADLHEGVLLTCSGRRSGSV